ncbi:MAG: SOS response-associated peptidase [Actinomycetota bacterium]
MCGRIVQVMPPDEVAAAMDAVLDADLGPGTTWRPRWNMPPSQLALVVAPVDGARRLERAVWGLPGGPQHPTRSLFNARAETVDRLPSFREAFRTGRVLVPVDAFYEWENPEHLAARAEGTPPRGRRQPWAFLPSERPLLALVGIAVRGATSDGEPIRLFSLVTTRANDVVGAIHDRMPAMVFGEDLGRWLDPETPREELFPMLEPAPDAALVARRVSTAVSSVRNDGPELLDAVAAEPRLF